MLNYYKDHPYLKVLIVIPVNKNKKISNYYLRENKDYLLANKPEFIIP